ncbi:MAG: hypothetical protein DI538_07500 [Azospira oryzae]|jgi:PAS domain S-box-containing protein|nr:MAG: hypothetical protein DI538_07500 [Azospira oryzae]
MNRSLIPETELITREKFLNALAETYLLQDAILNSTELSVISVNTEGTIISFNPAAERLLGYTHPELIGKWSLLIIHEWNEIILHAEETSQLLGILLEPGFDSIVAKARITKSADRREWTYIRKDGSRFPVMLSLSGIWNDKGELTGYLGIASDITVQKKNDERIRQSEAHLKALLYSIDDIAIEISRDRIYTNVWTKHDQLLFAQRDQYIGKTIHEVLSGPYAHLFDLYDTTITKVFVTGKAEYIEYWVNDPRPWRSAKISFIDHNSVLVLIRDITETKEVEQKIKESEQKFRLLAENLPGTIYLCKNDATFSMLYLNEHVVKMTGYAIADFISGQINFVQLYHPEDAPVILTKVDEALTQQRSFHIVYRLRHKEGHWLWIEEFGAGVYNKGELIFLEGFLSDITSRKEAEEKIIRISEEHDRVFNYSISLNAIAGFDGYFKKLNPVWEKTLGYSVEELTSVPFMEFVHPDDLNATRGTTNTQVNQGRDVTTFENRYRCKDGTYRWLLWTSSTDVASQLIYASAIDITERKEAEEILLLSKSNLETATEELQEQNQQLNSFAHVISHNLRSPVGNINALISLLNEKSSIKEYQEIFHQLKLTAASMSETLNDLMDTLKVKKSSATDLVPLRFSTVLKKVMQDLAGEIIRSNATISSDFSACEEIRYNKPYLESIFLNLLSNTLKYRSPERPLQVKFTAKQEDGHIVLRVSDNGLGIDLNLYGNKLFGLRKTFHEHKDAKGVGLFLTKTQVEALGGKIWIESQVDKGTTVAVQF